MKQDLWRRVEALFHEAREHPPAARLAFVEDACDGDLELRREVLRLLSKEAEAADFLEGAASGLGREVAVLLAGDPHDDNALPVTPPAAQGHPALDVGRRLGPYEIQSVIGAGGMGEVYQARDTRLDRAVAIKILPPGLAEHADTPRSNTPWRVRFEREAKAIARLNHPHVCALHDVGEQDGFTFLVMEHIDGQTLAERIRCGPLPLDVALKTALEVADALGAAHREGIVHRDLKPANVMVTTDGRAKVLDFGLARRVARLEVQSEALPTDGAPTGRTFSGAGPSAERSVSSDSGVVGTAAYMSPEQVEGRALDSRSDVFSFGAVLYELLTGRRAFPGQSPASAMSAILHDTPVPVRKVRDDVPSALDAVVSRCLEKSRDRRYASGIELHEALAACEAQMAARAPGAWTILRDRRLTIAALAVAAVLLAALSWSFWRSSRANWARTTALPEIARLIDQGRTAAAFRLVRRAERYLPNDPDIARLRQNYQRRISLLSDPPGADVYVRDYLDTAADARWDYLGRTPLQAVTIPAGHLAYRISRPGYTTVEGSTAGARTAGVNHLFSIKLDRQGTAPRDMVRVPGGRNVGEVRVDQEFWLDKYEVTNARYKAFVDRGGYAKAEYWKAPFVEGGRTIGWEQATGRFTDATGRPGPAAWASGTFPPGQDDYPVAGVSWYEAAAFCESEGKVLPTVHHWRAAADTGLFTNTGLFTTILQTSNLNGRGPARVGSYAGLGQFGTYDAAGNVREWCLNASGDQRCILGAAWNDPSHLFLHTDTRPPMDRSNGNGIRCAKYVGAVPGRLMQPVEATLVVAGHAADRPASDEVFEVYKTFHAYDHGPLDARKEASDDTSPFWRQEKVSFRAAYGDERVTAYLFIPKNADPPFQAVVTFPGNYALDLRSSARLETQWSDFFVRSGRVVVHPIFEGMYERTIGGTYSSYIADPNTWRPLAIQWHKDLGRTLDYLESRSDFDHAKIAYHGVSLGTVEAPRLLALEPRLKVAVLFWGGFLPRAAADVSPLHYAPRSTVPTLMVSGEFDPLFPQSTSQIPMFRLLGTPDVHKHHKVVEGAGHVAFNQEVIRESVAWLDRYLGPVRTR